MNGLTFKLVMRLVDNVSNEAARVAQSVDRMANRVSSAGGRMNSRLGAGLARVLDADRIEAGLARAEHRIVAARSRLMDAAAMAGLVIAPTLSIARFEHQLAHFGNITDLAKSDLARIEQELRQSAADVNQTASNLLEGLGFLMGKGMSEPVAAAIIKDIGKAATATGASITAMSAAGFAAVDNLDIPVERIAAALDKMAKAGKLGGFELKDMAQHFPGLTAAAKGLGMTGEDALEKLAAALQIAVKGAANPDEAANNFKNFLAKIASPETVTAFKKFGIDIRTELAKAAEAGIDPMEYMVVRLNDLAKDNPHIISDIFGDMQVQQFLRPMLDQLEEYRRIRDELKDADGVIDKDHARVMDTVVERWKAFLIELDNATSAGAGMTTVIKDLLVSLTGALRAVNDFATRFPELTGWIIKAGVALLAFGIASRVLSFGLALAGGGAFRLASSLRGLAMATGAAIRMLARFRWAAFIKPLKWAAFIPRLAWSAFVRPLAWAGRVARLAWGSMVSRLAWSRFVPRLSWGSLLAGAGKLRWSMLITPLKWFGRFIPVIGWALLAADLGMLAWDLVIKPLHWDKYLSLDALRSLGGQASAAAKSLYDAILKGLGELSSIGTAIIDGILSGLQAGWQSVTGWLSQKAEALAADLKGLFNFGWGEEGGTAQPVAAVPGNDNPVQDPGTARLRQRAAAVARGSQDQTSEGAARPAGASQGRELPFYRPPAPVPPAVVEVEKTVDQSRHVVQHNTYSITVNGGPAAAGQAALSSIRTANGRALRDID